MLLAFGDKVRLKENRKSWWEAKESKDQYMGKIVTVADFVFPFGKWGFLIAEDGGKNIFYPEDVEYCLSKKHFKSLPNNYTGIIEVEDGFIKDIIKEKNILEKTEKKYLKSVIKPFKNRINHISKKECPSGDCYISIDLDGGLFDLPIFKKGTMYNGMIEDKKYTLRELELDE